ncbi:hypothetical protein NQ318_007971 [Aromia moschata]|uniref:Uncharacterized protein n=1 Tax=Aromia moschata TaxID=1265417 RepID=A0AAV8YA59_9CUCU|nr:hypothetical protein NQ318_007971 [Aromia moschata]
MSSNLALNERQISDRCLMMPDPPDYRIRFSGLQSLELYILLEWDKLGKYQRTIKNILVAFVALAATATASPHGLDIHGGLHGGYGGGLYGGGLHGGAHIVNPHALSPIGPSGIVTGHGASGPSGVVTGAGAIGPSGIVTGKGPIGPTGPATGHDSGLGHGAAIVVAAPAVGLGHGLGLGGHGLGYGGHGLAALGHGGWGLGGHGYGHGHGWTFNISLKKN